MKVDIKKYMNRCHRFLVKPVKLVISVPTDTVNMVLVRLHYGQYKVCDIIKYRTQRLYGITKELTDEGYDVELIPSQHWDRLEIEIAGRTIFTCRLTFLEFNSSVSEDKLAAKAVQAVQDAISRMQIPEPAAPLSGKVMADAGKVSSIQRNMLTIIDKCSMLEDFDISDRAVGIRGLIDAGLEKDSIELIQQECIEWEEEISPDDVEIQEALDSVIEACTEIDDNWDLFESLKSKICKSCTECIPFCRCSSLSSAETLKEACSVCGPYCVCKKLSHSELIKLCRTCGLETCICSSSSEGSIEICNIVIKKQKEDKESKPKKPVTISSDSFFCNICGPVCDCPHSLACVNQQQTYYIENQPQQAFYRKQQPYEGETQQYMQ